MSRSPLVSVIVPNYGTDQYLSEAVESILDQTYENFEILLVDSSGGESPKTVAKRDDRIRHLYQEPTGPAAARNYGLDEARGDLVAFLDADDYWREDKLEVQIAKLERADIDILYSDEYLLEGTEKTYYSTLEVTDPDRHYIEYFKRGSGVPIRTVIGDRECFDQHRFYEPLRAREDPHLWIRVFSDFTPGRIAEPLAYNRIRNEGVTGDIERMYESEIESIADLVERLPELEQWRAFRESRTHYKYGKRYLERGQPLRARRAFARAIRRDPRNVRAWVLLGIAVAPLSPERQKRVQAELEQAYTTVFG